MSLESVRNELRDFAEDYESMQLSHKAHEWIWQLIQNIDHELENNVQPRTFGICGCGLKPRHKVLEHDWCCQICGKSHSERICPIREDKLEGEDGD